MAAAQGSAASSCISDASLSCTNGSRERCWSGGEEGCVRRRAASGGGPRQVRRDLCSCWPSAETQTRAARPTRLTLRTAAGGGRRAELPANCSVWNLWTKDNTVTQTVHPGLRLLLLQPSVEVHQGRRPCLVLSNSPQDRLKAST